jgi:hypothetical protein
MHSDAAQVVPARPRRVAPRVSAYLPSDAVSKGSTADMDVIKAFKRLQNGSDVRGVALSSK